MADDSWLKYVDELCTGDFLRMIRYSSLSYSEVRYYLHRWKCQSIKQMDTIKWPIFFKWIKGSIYRSIKRRLDYSLYYLELEQEHILNATCKIHGFQQKSLRYIVCNSKGFLVLRKILLGIFMENKNYVTSSIMSIHFKIG